MGTIKALCISEKKGTLKTPIHKALFQTEWGMVGDAHAGRWHRQVSFLGLAEIEEFRKRGIDVKLGAFGENIVADGFHFKELPIGTRLRAGEVWFEITQIGKECHKSCAIRSQVGDCIMPREGRLRARAARRLDRGRRHARDRAGEDAARRRHRHGERQGQQGPA